MVDENEFCSSSLMFGDTIGISGANALYTTEGFFSIMLDLLSYRPELPTNNTMILSLLGVCRMEHRNNVLFAKSIDNDEEPIVPPVARQRQREIPLQFRQARLGRRRTAKWSDASKVFLRYIKLACLEFAISPHSR